MSMKLLTVVHETLSHGPVVAIVFSTYGRARLSSKASWKGGGGGGGRGGGGGGGGGKRGGGGGRGIGGGGGQEVLNPRTYIGHRNQTPLGQRLPVQGEITAGPGESGYGAQSTPSDEGFPAMLQQPFRKCNRIAARRIHRGEEIT
ncbi:RNA-binding protein cabeza-like [Macrobrachium nipponense]|uniref:RNA-binding protein cabeza-like n=1 Tax=Macrobrachium nipponense TaxID=159736 RepID=UPI0030C89D2A